MTTILWGVVQKQSSGRNIAEILKGSVRWIVAIVLLVWLFSSGKLASLRDLERLFHSPWLFGIAFMGVVVNYVMNFCRWHVLLKGVHIRIPFSEVTRLSMIGQFSSIFLPGAVGGDLVKAVYVAKAFPAQKTDGVASILLDRILGFLSLLVFASLFFVLSFDATHLPKALQGFGLFLALGTLALLMIVILPGKAAKVLSKFKTGNPIIERLQKILRGFSRSRSTLFYALFLSFVGQASALFAFYIIGNILYGSLPWGNMDTMRFISATAVGTTASAIPLAPMGLGVGQIAFGKVFKLLGSPEESYGIVLISAAQIINFVLNLSGVIWVLKTKKSEQS